MTTIVFSNGDRIRYFVTIGFNKRLICHPTKNGGLVVRQGLEGFFDHVLRTHESYSEKWEYVRMNSVRAQLSAKIEAWPYQGEIARIPFE